MKQITMKATALLSALIIAATLILTAAAAPLATHIGIVKARGGLRLRSEPTTASKILDTARYGDSVVVLEKHGDWYKVNYNLQIGYMSGEYLTLKERENVELGTGSVDASAVNMRSGPSTSNSRVELLYGGSEVEIFGFNCGWYKVRTRDNRIGYIRSDLLELLDKPLENYGASGSSSSSTSSSSAGQKLADYAKALVGCPYVYGGTTTAGFDCSGFVQYCARNNGYSINRTATAQLSNGEYVSRENLQPGDLVFFGYGSTATHVGIYVGNGNFVHAQNSNTGVVITSLSQTYYDSRYLTARRITG